MTTSSLLYPERRRLIQPIDRRRLLFTGTAAGASLVMPNISWAATGGCDTINALLSNAREQSNDPAPWTRENGAIAIARLEAQIPEARDKLDAALKRGGELDRALLVDIITLVGGAAFFAVGIATTGILTALGAKVLLVSGLAFGTVMFFAQLATNDAPPDDFSMVTAGGGLESALGTMGDKFAEAGVAISRNLGKFMALAGKLLGAVTLALTAKETQETYSEGAKVDQAIEELRDALADLTPQLADLHDREAMNELRQASATALAEDLEPYSTSECETPKRKKRPKLIRK